MEIRIRVAGLLKHRGHLLLAKHRTHAFWLLPGGKLEEGETIPACVKREFWEEAGLRVRKLRGSGKVTVARDSTRHVDVTIILGPDFRVPDEIHP